MHLLQWLGRWLAGHHALRWLGRTAMGRALIRLYRAIAPENIEGGARPGGFEIGILIVTCVGLTLTQFGGDERVFLDLFGDALREDLSARLPAGEGAAPLSAHEHPFYELFALLHWVAFCILGYVALPALWLKASGRSAIDGAYLRPGGFARHLGIYALLFGLVMVPVVIVSFQPIYQSIYPFYKQAGRSWADLIAWELAYGAQFFALEYLFRGVLLEGLRRWIGYGAVGVMILPYCMLHFMKTSSESLGAIIAGLVLGCLAMKYRSIWGGVLLHWGVAISMDVLSLAHQSQLPSRWMPPGW